MSSITVFSWSDSKQPGITPLIWADHYKSPADAAAVAIPLLKVLPAGKRAIMPWWGELEDAKTNRTAFTLTDAQSVVTMVTSGPDFIEAATWSYEYYLRLWQAGCTVDRIVCDEEGRPNWWTIPTPQATIAALYASPAARAVMTLAMLKLSPANFASVGPNDPAVTALNQWLAQRTTPAMRKTLVDTAFAAFGCQFSVSNFGDLDPWFPVYDPNGWTIPANLLGGPNAAILPGNYSAPGLYLVPGQRHGPVQGRTKSPYWNAFIDANNYMRSCRGPISPWLSYPSYAGDGVTPPAGMRWLWTELAHHAAALGVGTFNYWNPAEQAPAGDDAYAASVFASLKPSTRRTAMQLQLDADQVQTGNEVTTYEQYLKHAA